MIECENTRVWEELEPLVDGFISDSVGEYIERQSYDHQERLADSFAQLQERSTPAFRANVDAIVGAAMPTSFQESGYVRHALNQYDNQRVTGRHRLVGYLNWPNNVTPRHAQATRNELDRFIADNPHIPFGYFEGSEVAPIAIGGIRKLVTDSLMAVSYEDALLMGHDADQRWLNRTHFDDLLTAYCQSPHPLAGVLPEVTHSRLPAHLSNMDMLVRWFEDPEHLKLIGIYFEPGPAFGAPQYRAVGGYNATDNLGETHNLLAAIELSPLVDAHDLRRVPQAQLVISPRRLVQKLDTYHRLEQFWTGGEDFSAVHEYRTGHEAYGAIRDLPNAVRDMRLREYGQITLARAVMVAQHDPDITDPHAYALCELEKIRQRIGGPEDMFVD